jgi:hypothetical protein
VLLCISDFRTLVYFRLILLAFFECLQRLVVRFHVPSAVKAEVWVSILDLLLASRCYRRVGSASPPKFRFQVS